MNPHPTHIEAVADAAASSMSGVIMTDNKPMTPFDQAVAKAAAEFREELEAAYVEAEAASKRNPWWKK